MSQGARNYSEHSDSAHLCPSSSRCHLIAVQLETQVPGSPGPQDCDSGSMLVTVAPCWEVWGHSFVLLISSATQGSCAAGFEQQNNNWCQFYKAVFCQFPYSPNFPPQHSFVTPCVESVSSGFWNSSNLFTGVWCCAVNRVTQSSANPAVLPSPPCSSPGTAQPGLGLRAGDLGDSEEVRVGQPVLC